MSELYRYYYLSPVGTLCVEADADAVTGLHIEKVPANGENRENELIRDTIRQLKEYFSGKRRQFTVPLRTEGTVFQQTVWEALRRIPYGETRTYGEIATAVGRPAACRAVGGANHKNPIMILIPCHRVIGADGSLKGFGGGLDVKEKLLMLEGSIQKKAQYVEAEEIAR